LVFIRNRVKLLRKAAGQIRHFAVQAVLLTADIIRMVDINDFGRYITRNLGRRFLALSGVVTFFALIGQYTRNIVYEEENSLNLADNFLDNFVANFIFFGIPGALLLLFTQLFSFFNRSNYFAAQANYINLLETIKKTPANLEKLVNKLWSFVYKSEYAILANGRPHISSCTKVKEIRRRKIDEKAGLIAEICSRAGTSRSNHEQVADSSELPAQKCARDKYEAHRPGAELEGYKVMQPWDRLSIAERCIAIDKIIHEETVDEITRQRLHLCEDGFKFNASWALSTAMQLNIKHTKAGMDLKLVDDWLDGAFFDLTDIKLIEQYMAEATIKSAKLQTRVPRVSFIMVQGVRTFAQRLWTSMLFGITSKRIGRYLNHLNHKYVREESDLFDRDYFKAEAFLWWSEMYDTKIREELGDGALSRLKSLRKRWLFMTFGKLKKPRLRKNATRQEIERGLEKNTQSAIRNASRIIKRMFAGSVYNIHEMRLLYDPDYVILMTNRDTALLDRMGLGAAYLERNEHGLEKKLRSIKRSMKFIRKLSDSGEMARHGFEMCIDNEARRALRVAFHANVNGLKTLSDREAKQGYDEDLRKKIYRIVEQVIVNKKSYSRKIRKLKTFETLAIHHLKSYINTLARFYRDLQQTHLQELIKRLDVHKRDGS